MVIDCSLQLQIADMNNMVAAFVRMTRMAVQLQSQTSQARHSAVAKQQGQKLYMELTRLNSAAGVAVSPSTCTA